MSDPLAHLLRGERSPRVRVAYGAAAALGALLVVALSARDFARPGNRWHVESYEAAVWAREHLPPTAVLAREDTGIPGYFSRRSVLNLDGVVGDFAYQDALKQGRLGDYLARQGVGYLADHDFGDTLDADRYERAGMRIFSRRYADFSETVWVRYEDEVYRSRPYPHERYRVVFAIWRWPGDGARAPLSLTPGAGSRLQRPPAGTSLNSLSFAASARSHDR